MSWPVKTAIASKVSGTLSVPAYSAGLAGIGDSLTYQNTYGSPVLLRAIGFITWACVLSEGTLTFSNEHNFGKSGETSAQILSRLTAAIAKMKASNIKFCTVHAGVNDISATNPVIPATTTVANLETMYKTLLAEGITPIGFPIMPRSYQMTTAVLQRQQYVNNMLRQKSQEIPGLIFFDPTTAISDSTLADGSPIGGTPPTGATAAEALARAIADTSDGLHWSCRGAFKVGKRLLKAIYTRLQALPVMPGNASNLYHITENPYGSMVLNPTMQGSVASAATGTSGVTATGWILQRQAGTTGNIAGSKGTYNIDDDNSAPTQILQMSAPSGASSEVFRFYQVAYNPMAVGTKFQGSMHVTVSGVGANSLRYVKLIATDGAVLTTCLAEDSGNYMPNNSWSGLLVTPIAEATAINTQLLRLEVALDGTVAGNAVTVTIRQANFRKF